MPVETELLINVFESKNELRGRHDLDRCTTGLNARSYVDFFPADAPDEEDRKETHRV